METWSSFWTAFLKYSHFPYFQPQSFCKILPRSNFLQNHIEVNPPENGNRITHPLCNSNLIIYGVNFFFFSSVSTPLSKYSTCVSSNKSYLNELICVDLQSSSQFSLKIQLMSFLGKSRTGFIYRPEGLQLRTHVKELVPISGKAPFGPQMHSVEDRKKGIEIRMGNKYRKPTTLRCNAGSRCSISAVVWSLVGFLVMLHLNSLMSRTETQSKAMVMRINHHPLLRELQEVEEENMQMPPPRRRSQRGAKRKTKPAANWISEFLDESSQIRHLFFPSAKMAVDPMKDIRNSSLYYYPGRVWLDTDGNPIQAHGGGILYDEKSKTYYWYGEYKDGPTYRAHKKGAARVDVIGVGCYSSKDLWTWKNEGIVLAAEDKNETHDLHKLKVLERPKVIHNDKTGKYVMWMHIDDANYTKASIGVAISDSPTGPFRYLYSKRPHGFDSRDMMIFKDEDGAAYLIYSSSNNTELHVSPLNENYLDLTPVMRRILVAQRREAPALFKHEGTYYMITSGCSGWAPNAAVLHAAGSIMGPWEVMGNPCIGGNNVYRLTTFFAQGTYVLPLPGVPGFFIFMADRWNPVDLRDSRYVWLPMTVAGAADQPLDYNFGFPLWPRVSVYWHRKWRLPGKAF